MPPKKRLLSQRSYRSVRLEHRKLLKHVRFNETEEVKSERLEKDMLAKRARIDQESNVDRSQRLEKIRVRISKIRSLSRAQKTHNIARKSIFAEEHYIGLMTTVCEECGSINFENERPDDGKFSLCCHKGKVKLNPLEKYPNLLKDLLTGKHSDSKNFIDNIRSYNSAFAFASMGADLSLLEGPGPYCYRIHGQIYHRVSPLHPNESDKPRFAQIYIFDSDQALDMRMNITQNKNCLPKLMSELNNIMKNNKFAESYKMLRDVELEEENRAKSEGRSVNPIEMIIKTDRNDDQRRYNAPKSNEVAIVFQNIDGEPPYERDIQIHLKDSNKTKQIQVDNPNCDPMTYPILFPNAEQGWHKGLKLSKGQKRENMTLLQFYSYRLSIRNSFNPILNAGKLAQQYIVDAYVKIEGNRLSYLRYNQQSLRVEHYKGLMDHIDNVQKDKNLKPGKMIILPSSYIGSPRALQQNYQDAMAIVRKYGKPDLFITITCNPNWKEITENLKEWNSPQFRPDLIARIFNLKLKELKKDLMYRHILGISVAWLYVIEFQKRGLPHAHILIVLKDEDKPRTSDIIDQIVCAELPDQENEQRLFQIVMRNMIHGPCNSVCLIDGKCCKGFPKDYEEFTNPNVDGYPRYRRRQDGRIFKKRNTTVDNRWVVPYNNYLLSKYNCHLNVEICASIKSIKYLFKYVYKGHDCANIEIFNYDEIKAYLDTRYVSSPEAMWRIFSFKMHNISHVVSRLAVHLPEEQNVYFKEGDEMKALEAASSKATTLTAWFKLNAKDHFASRYLYAEIPENYWFNKKTYCWEKRKNLIKVVSRMYTVSISDGERYYLRLLLLHVHGATSFEDIRTYKKIVYPTFQEAAIARNLLADDKEWEDAIEEAISFQMPKILRQLFAYICIFGNPIKAELLWQKFSSNFIEDFVNQKYKNPVSLAMKEIEEILRLHKKSYIHFNLPKPADKYEGPAFDIQTETLKGIENVNKMNEDQRSAFNEIMAAIECKTRINCFFMDGPGGSGKTFLYNSLISVLRGKSKAAIAIASTGIAATLLAGGRTLHSQFKLPLTLNETSNSSLIENSDESKYIQSAAMVIWDEATMSSHYALDAVDRLLKDLMHENKKPFGGKVVLLGGDFRQCLPVVKHGNRVTIVQSSIKYSKLWPSFKQLRLNKNMRTSEKQKDFNEWLLKLGNGILNNEEDNIEIPREFITENNIIDCIFGKKIELKEIYSFFNRAILCPKNDATFEINDQIVNRLEGIAQTYLSIDSVASDNEKESLDYPVELLNSLSFSGMPPHKLTLKIGCIIMLLRNLNTRAGLCNGTRLIVINLKSNVIDAQILKDKTLGERVFIPRIELITSNEDFPVPIKRRQFPIRLAFAMTINKSQGQTLDKVGIYLRTPVFAHGQLYVAFSRVQSSDNVMVFIQEDSSTIKKKKTSKQSATKNIVYNEIFQSRCIKNNRTFPIVTHVNDLTPHSKKVSIENESSDSDSKEIVNSLSVISMSSTETSPLEEKSYYIELSQKASRFLKKLLEMNAYASMKRLVEIWDGDIRFQTLASEIIRCVRSFPIRYATDESEVRPPYKQIIQNNYPSVVSSFLPVDTESKGDCFYCAISINLTGNCDLATALRFATVSIIIQEKNVLKTVMIRRLSEQSLSITSDLYRWKLKDFACSAGISRKFYNNDIASFEFPDHLNVLNADIKLKFHYANHFHQFIISIITNRPLHCYGELNKRAQRVLWAYEFEGRDSINFIFLCNNHYVALIPKSHATIRNERYTYFCKFLSEEDNNAFANRSAIPAKEVPFDVNQPIIIID